MESKKERRWNRIPLDLMIEILLRLPATSVARFRLACKLWHSTTTDPGFVDAHLDRARKASPPSILLTPFYLAHGERYFTILEGSTWTPKQRFSKWPEHKGIRLHGSCNGILCISGDADERIQLLNPATGKSMTIPRPPNFDRVDFGFHPSTKEYKVIHIHSNHSKTTPDQTLPFIRCEVCTLGAAGSWREINTSTIPDFCPSHAAAAAIVNGMMYYISHAYTSSIVSFNLGDESFKQFPLTGFEIQSPGSVRIVELQGSVWMSITSKQGMNVWRLSVDEDESITEYRLMHSISPCNFMYPLSPLFIHKDKMVTTAWLHNAFGYGMKCYGYVKTGKFGSNEILYAHDMHYCATVHVESLVALPNE